MSHMNQDCCCANQPSDTDALRLDARLRLLEAGGIASAERRSVCCWQRALVQVRRALTTGPASHPDAMLTFARVILALAKRRHRDPDRRS